MQLIRKTNHHHSVSKSNFNFRTLKLSTNVWNNWEEFLPWLRYNSYLLLVDWLNIEMEHSQIFEPVSTFVTPDKNLLKILGNNGENIWVAINFEKLTICYTTSLLLFDLLLWNDSKYCNYLTNYIRYSDIYFVGCLRFLLSFDSWHSC